MLDGTVLALADQRRAGEHVRATPPSRLRGSMRRSVVKRPFWIIEERATLPPLEERANDYCIPIEPKTDSIPRWSITPRRAPRC